MEIYAFIQFIMRWTFIHKWFFFPYQEILHLWHVQIYELIASKSLFFYLKGGAYA